MRLQTRKSIHKTVRRSHVRVILDEKVIIARDSPNMMCAEPRFSSCRHTAEIKGAVNLIVGWLRLLFAILYI